MVVLPCCVRASPHILQLLLEAREQLRSPLRITDLLSSRYVLPDQNSPAWHLLGASNLFRELVKIHLLVQLGWPEHCPFLLPLQN
jgi:hypothetical protein